jgi:hypothetical protein
LTFDPVEDLLGSGTVGEVFRVTLGERVWASVVKPFRA